MIDLQEQIKIGKVSSVDVKKRTARVIFEDKEDMVSAELKVLINHPLIKIVKKDNGAEWGGGGAYNSAPRNLGGGGAYNSAPRNLGGDSYKKTLPDTVDLSKVIIYQGEPHTHNLHVEIHPWLPYVGQFVLCAFPSIGAGDGFILGGF